MEEKLLDWCFRQHPVALFQAFMAHEGQPAVEGSAARNVTEFLLYVPSRTHALPYHLACHNVAYATFAHVKMQTDDSVIFEFMGNRKAIGSTYTLWCLLSMRGLGEHIVRLFLNKAHKISRSYVLVTGRHPLLEIGVKEGTDTHDRFTSLAEMLLQLYSCYVTSNIEIV